MPNERKIHNKKILKVGGVGILFSSLFILCFYRIINEEEFLKMNLIEGQVMVATIFLCLGGIVDDIIEINAPKKLFFQFIAIFLIIKSGFIITLVHNFHINLILTVVFYILVINSMNLIDGIDGLSGTLFLLFTLSTLVIAFYIPLLDSKYYILIAIFIGSLVSFLYLNLPPAKIFLGDTGSQLLGWIIAVTTAYLTSFFEFNYQKIYLLSFISLPFYDVLFVMIKRFFTRDGNFLNKLIGITKPDQNHIHHLLLRNDFSTLKSLIYLNIFYLLCLIIAIFPICLDSYYLPIFIMILIFNIVFRLFFEFKLNK
tara:strand:- start:2275 stop:3213 length:939 start_codon:yes stop_codon:yes gene_type:complete